MKYTALFLIATLAISSAYVVQEAEFDAEPVLAQTEKARPDFGDIVELMETSTEGGLASSVKDRITKFLDDYKKNLKEEGKKQDELHEKNQEECAEEKKFRLQEIRDGVDAAARSGAHRDLCQGEAIEAQEIYNHGVAYFEEYTQLLNNAKDRRKMERETNDRHSAEIAAANKGITQCLKLLDELEANVNSKPAALIQEVNALLAVSITTGHHQHMVPVYQSLVSVSSQGGLTSAEVAEVRTKLEDFQKNLSSASADVDAREKAQQAFFDKEEKDYTTALTRLANQKNRAQKYADQMNACVKQETGIFNMANQKVKHNEASLLHSEEICDADERAYAAAVANRIREFRLVEQLEKAILHLAVEYLQATLPKVGNVINLVKTKADKTSKKEQYRICKILKVHNLQDPDCDKLAQDITV